MNWWDIAPPFIYCVFHHISVHLPRQCWFWKISKTNWVSVRPPHPPLLGQMPKFFWKSILTAPLSLTVKIGTLVTTLLFRMDEPNPRPEDIYKRPEELFNHPKPPKNYGESQNHPKPPKNYGESQSPTDNKKRQRFQRNLGLHRGKKPWQVGVDEIYQIAMMTKQDIITNVIITRKLTKMAIASSLQWWQYK